MHTYRTLKPCITRQCKEMDSFQLDVVLYKDLAIALYDISSHINNSTGLDNLMNYIQYQQLPTAITNSSK